jgi:hypothetical protein
MTSNNLPTWQRHLNPKLVKRFHNLLTKPGVVNISMARNIIERSPELFQRLPLLAQQMQRWSTTIDLKSESTPIVYVKNQAVDTGNYKFTSSESSQINKQLPVVKAKAITAKETGEKNERSPSKALVLKQDNSFPNLDTNISTQSQYPTTENSDISEIPIQHKLDTTSSPSVNLPVVQADKSQNKSLSINQDIPLINVVNQNSPVAETTSTSDIPIQRKLDTTSSVNLPVVQADKSQNKSLSVNQDIPLVNVTNNQNSPLGESVSSSNIPIQRKLDTTSSPSVNLPVVQADKSQNKSLSINQDIPLINVVNQNSPVAETTSTSNIPIQRKLDTTSSVSLPVVQADKSQNKSLSINQDIPLINVVNQNSPITETTSTSNIPIQRKLDTTSSPSVNLPVVKADNSDQNKSLSVNQDIPLINVVNQNSPLDESVSSSNIPIQRKLDTTSSVNLPVVQADKSQNKSLSINQDIPLINVVNQNSPITETTLTSNIPIQRKLDTTSSVSLPVVQADKSQNKSLSINQDIPLINVVNQNSPLGESVSSSNIPIQRKLDTTSSPSVNLPVVKADNSDQNKSLSVNQDIPLINVVNQNSPLGESVSSSNIPIQRKLDTTSAPSVNLPVVKADNSDQNKSLSVNQDIPLINVVNQNSPVGETTSTSHIPIQRKLDTTSAPSVNLPVVKADNSSPTKSLSVNQDIPLVNEISQPIIPKKLGDLVKKNNNISPVDDSLSASINVKNHPSNLTIPIKPKLETKNTVVVYSRTKNPKSAYNEEILLLEKLQKKNPSVVAEKAENITQVTLPNDKFDLPVVQVNSESYLSEELEPLILSNYPIAKPKQNSLNNGQLNQQTNLMATTNYSSTSSPNQQNSLSSSIPGVQSTTTSINSHPPPVKQNTENSVMGVNLPPQINIDDLVEKVERKIMRKLVIESERRGKRKWR